MDFEDYARRLSAWQLETFGPGQRLAGVVEHIRSELRELEECNGADLSEWADVIILAINGTWRNGFTAAQLSDELERKLAVNRARTWPDWRTIPADQPIEHDRSGETLPAGNATGAAPERSLAHGWPTVYGIPMIFTHRPMGGSGECPECGQETASITVSIAPDKTSRISTPGAPDRFGRFTVWAFGFKATNSPCCGLPGARLELTQPETQSDLTMRVWRAWRGGVPADHPVAAGLKGHPDCALCQCYPEARNDCPDHSACRERIRAHDAAVTRLESAISAIVPDDEQQTIYGLPAVFIHSTADDNGKCGACGRQTDGVVIKIVPDQRPDLTFPKSARETHSFVARVYGWTASGAQCCSIPAARLAINKPETTAVLAARALRVWRGGVTTLKGAQ